MGYEISNSTRNKDQFTVTTLRFYFQLIVALFTVFAGSVSCATAQTNNSLVLAQKVPIADVHMHLNSGHPASFYREQMERNGVQWGGGVGGGPRDFPIEIGRELAGRHITALGQTEFFGVFFSQGTNGLLNEDHPIFQKLFSQAENAFRDGQARGFGELHINNMSPFSPAGTQRRIPLDSPVVNRMFSIANRYNGFIQVHTMKTNGLEEILIMTARYPRVKLILSHCLPGATPDDLSFLFKKRSNIFCELSAQGPSHSIQRVYTNDGLRPAWRNLIITYPSRFMVGTDPCCGHERRYDEIIKEIRIFLLASLPTPIIPLIAYQNAVRELKLKY